MFYKIAEYILKKSMILENKHNSYLKAKSKVEGKTKIQLILYTYFKNV